MFFIIGGIQPRTISLDRDSSSCPVCGNSRASLVRVDHYLSLFFIPLFRVKKGHPVIFCPNCRDPEIQAAPPPEEAGTHPVSRCNWCGKAVQKDFVYCPYCRKRL